MQLNNSAIPRYAQESFPNIDLHYNRLTLSLNANLLPRPALTDDEIRVFRQTNPDRIVRALTNNTALDILQHQLVEALLIAERTSYNVTHFTNVDSLDREAFRKRFLLPARPPHMLSVTSYVSNDPDDLFYDPDFIPAELPPDGTHITDGFEEMPAEYVGAMPGPGDRRVSPIRLQPVRSSQQVDFFPFRHWERTSDDPNLDHSPQYYGMVPRFPERWERHPSGRPVWHAGVSILPDTTDASLLYVNKERSDTPYDAFGIDPRELLKFLHNMRVQDLSNMPDDWRLPPPPISDPIITYRPPYQRFVCSTEPEYAPDWFISYETEGGVLVGTHSGCTCDPIGSFGCLETTSVDSVGVYHWFFLKQVELVPEDIDDGAATHSPSSMNNVSHYIPSPFEHYSIASMTHSMVNDSALDSESEASPSYDPCIAVATPREPSMDDDDDDDPDLVAGMEWRPQHHAFMALNDLDSNDDNARTLVVDSGSSSVLFNTPEPFAKIERHKSMIQTAGEDCLECIGKGVARISLWTDDAQRIDLELPALYCPDATRSLLGVSTITKLGWSLHIQDGHSNIVTDAGLVVPLSLHRNIWEITWLPATRPVSPDIALHAADSQTKSLDKAMILHLASGHINAAALHRAAKRDVRGLPKLTGSEWSGPACWDCAISKAKRAGPGNMGVLYEHATVPLQLVFADLSGPHRVPAIGPDGTERVRWVLYLVDKFTRKRWIKPLEKKSDTTAALRQWLIDVNALTIYQVQRLHSDRGREFDNTDVKSLCLEFKISQTFSCEYTPTQNAYVERSIGETTKRAKANLQSSQMEFRFWYYSLLHACDGWNVLGNGKGPSPDELFFQYPADAGLLVPFGCRAFCWKDSRLATDPKWSISGSKGVIIGTGYHIGRRTYTVWTNDDKLIHPINVRYDSTFFPYRAPGTQRLTSEFFNPDNDPRHEQFVEADDPLTAVFTPLPVTNAGGDDGDDDLPFLVGNIDGRYNSDVFRITSRMMDSERALDHEHENLSHSSSDKEIYQDSNMVKTTIPAAEETSVEFEGVDLNLHDGKYAPDLVGRRVRKYYKYNDTWYNGTVMKISHAPQNTHKIRFHCLFDEDGQYDSFNYPQLLKILVNNDPDVAFTVSDILDDMVDDSNIDTSQAIQDEFTTRAEMLKQPDSQQFIEAERVEIQQMEDRDVMKWIDLPKGARVVSSKFVYKRKRDKKGEVKKHKCRWVARGFSQIKGLDFHESYSPVATTTAFRLILVFALILGLEVLTGDIKGAYLHAKLPNPVYMSPPKGYVHDAAHPNRVAMLKYSIYGLADSARHWFDLISKVLHELGFKPLDGSGCFLQYCNGPDIICLLVIHVDDFVMAWSKHQKWLRDRVIDKLDSLFGLSDVGPISYHLGMQVYYERGVKVCISQETYWNKVLQRFGFDKANFKGVSTPLDITKPISAADCPEQPNEEDRRLYASMFGSILYGAIGTRPDLAKAMSLLGRYMHNPGKSHIAALKRVLRYISRTKHYGLVYKAEDWTVPGVDCPYSISDIVAWTDSDWGGDLDNRLSTSGTIIMIAGGPVAWKSKLQRIQSHSSVEAEYISMGDGAKDVMYIRNICKESDFYPALKPTPMLIDNSSAIAISKGPGVTTRTRHIELRYHYVRQLVSDGEIAPTKIGTKDNLSDILTKAVSTEVFNHLVPHLVNNVSF